MGEHNYSEWEWHDGIEPCPAIYMDLQRPGEDAPFLQDVFAAVDTGSSLTAIPLKYKEDAKLVPSRYIPVRWPAYQNDKEPTYQVTINIEGYKARTVEIIFDPHHSDYGLIGRNLMKYWFATFRGPEYKLEIKDSD